MANYASIVNNNPGNYEDLDDNSRDILEFEIPQGLSVHASLHPNLHTEGSVTMSLPFFTTLSFSYHSKPQIPETKQNLLTSTTTPEASSEYNVGSNAIGIISEVQTLPSTIPTTPALANVRPPLYMTGLPPLPSCLPHSYFLSATIDAGKTLQADYIHRFSKNLEWRWYGVTRVTDIKDSEATCNLKYETEQTTGQIKFTTDNRLVGINILRSLGKQWSVGAEAFYTQTQGSGGFSIGSRYRNNHPTHPLFWTNTFNTVGDLSSALTSTLLPESLTLSAKCGVNVNNYKSDFSVGGEYKVKNFPMALKARYDVKGEIGIMASFATAYGGLHMGVTQTPKRERTFGIYFEI